MWSMARKLFGIVPILAAIWCVSYPAPGVWRVKKEDLGRKYRERVEYLQEGDAKDIQRGGRLLLSSQEAQAPTELDQFIKREIGSTRTRVSGEAWETIFQEAEDRQGEYLYLPANTVPLSSWVNSDRIGYTVELPGKYPVFLWVQLDSTHSAMFNDKIPWSMTHLYAPFSPWLAGVGMLFYILIPWYRRKENEATYSRLRSVIGPDITGMLLAGVFMALPLFIITQIYSHPRPFSTAGGQFWFCLVFWFMAGVGAVSFFISVWYEGLRFIITSAGIIKSSLKGPTEFTFDQMIEAEPIQMSLPRWLRAIAWLVVVFNWHLAGPLLLSAYTMNHGLQVPCRDGRTLKIWAVHLIGYERICQAIKEAGVALPEGTSEEMEKARTV